MIELEACMATQSWVNREYRRGLSTWGRPVRKSRSQLHRFGVETQGLELDDEFGGYYGVK